jgi:hypothetical protein
MEEEVIILELLGKSGMVREHVRLSRFPATIGRAYDNDVILDDEYVSPHHLVIERNEDSALRITDLNSENGLYRMPAMKRVDNLLIETDNLLLVGGTQIRIRRTDFVVAPTVLANRRRRSVQNTLTSAWLFMPLLLAVAALLLLQQYASTFQKIKYHLLVLETVSPLLGLVIWAGIWAFIGRILGHRAVFFAHFNIVLLALASLFGLNWFTDYYSFAFSATTSAELTETFALTLLGGLLLYGHLQLATRMKVKKAVITSGLVVGGLLSIFLLSKHVVNAEFNSKLSYPTVLRPAASIAGRPLSPEQFFSKTQAMKQQLDKARLEKN